MDHLRGFTHGRTPSYQPLLPAALKSEGWLEATPKPTRISRRRHIFIAIGALLSLASLAALVFFYGSTFKRGIKVVQEPCLAPAVKQEEQYVLGPPTQRFRDNLRNDTKYITSWINAGWTNDVMTYANLIYLGMITDRVPIIGPFTPSHIGGDVPPIAFGEVFDVARLREAIGPVIEWHELKDPASTEVEDIGCWNVWQVVQNNADSPRGSAIPHWVGLDVSYTRAPDWVKLSTSDNDPSSTFWSLATLAFPDTRARNMGNVLPSPQHNAILEPDEHVACYDYLYYTVAARGFEWEMDYAPMWAQVAKHFRWTQRFEDMAKDYLRFTFGLDAQTDIPPYISIHARHGDFSVFCNGRPKLECFTPLSEIAQLVQEIQQELLTRKGIEVTHVILTSDETDEGWWADATSRGWYKIDHEAARTAEIYGKWYPLVIDAVIQSNGLGFVGTEGSTMSLMARRRVEDWHGGVTRKVHWGTADPDTQ